MRVHGQMPLMLAVLIAFSSSAFAQVPESYKSVFQGLDSKKKDALDALTANLSDSDSAAILSRLPVGRAVHLATPALKTTRPVGPADDPKVIPIDKLPATLRDPNLGFEHAFDPSEFLPAYFLELGVQRQRSIARIRLKAVHNADDGVHPPGSGWGTGFLISDSLLMTNNHVIMDKSFASQKAVAQFNFQAGLDGAQQPVFEFDLDPDHGFYTNADLDYTVVRVKSTIPPGSGPAPVEPQPPGRAWGHLTLDPTVVYALKQPLNIIQHPAGRYKEVVLRGNGITEIFPNLIRYKASTEGGSSGSPVFDNYWRLIALHHRWVPSMVTGDPVSNEGVRIDFICSDLLTNATDLAKEAGLHAPGP